MRLIKFGVLLFGFACLLTSCETYKNIPYFTDIPDSARISMLNAPYRQLNIKPDDILAINIQTIDPSANAIFSQGVPSVLSTVAPANVPTGVSSFGMQNPSGYLVDKNGQVELPMIGKIGLAGLTTEQAADSIREKAAIFYKMPTVNVRFANLKITVLGEVLRPGSYVMPNEKNTIFDALGYAGDLTIYGKRENVLLIRDSAGKSSLIRFSLNSKKLVNEDFFYLRQNDVIYVEPNRSRIVSTDAVKNRNFTILASVLTVLIVLFTRSNF